MRLSYIVLMHRSGRLTLIKSALCAGPIYTMISIGIPGWLTKALLKIMQAFLWGGFEVVQNGKWLVAWSRVQWPLCLGGLEITDLKLMGIAFRARWLWLHRDEQHRSWASLPITTDAETKDFFNAFV
jgi:hypothetical protein